MSYSFGFSDYAPFFKVGSGLHFLFVNIIIYNLYTFFSLLKLAHNVFGLGEGGDFHHPPRRIDAENQTLINHKCVCGALNRHFCQTRVGCSYFVSYRFFRFKKNRSNVIYEIHEIKIVIAITVKYNSILNINLFPSYLMYFKASKIIIQ